MDFNNRYISFSIPGEWVAHRHDLDELAWNFHRKMDELYEGFGIRIISPARYPYTKRHLEQENSEQFISSPNYVNIGQKSIIIREINKSQFSMGSDVHGRLYAILIDFGELAVRIRVHLRENSGIMKNIIWADSLRIKENTVKRQLETIRQQADYVINDFILFYREMLGWNEVEALTRLETFPFNYRDKAESVSSLFYHELPVYWVFNDLLRLRLQSVGKSQVGFGEGQKLLSIFYDFHSGKIEENTSEEWCEIKERFEKQLKEYLNE